MAKVIKVDDEEEAVPTLVEMLGSKRFVRIDGHSGHGKSRVAKALCCKLDWPRVEVDNFLDGAPRNRRKYPEMVELPKLLAAIRAHPGGLVLDGICLNQLVPPETFGPELKVYVRSCFAPEFDLEEKRRQRQLGTDRYQTEYDPARWADIVILKLAI
jgi:hypothetical protein